MKLNIHISRTPSHRRRRFSRYSKNDTVALPEIPKKNPTKSETVTAHSTGKKSLKRFIGKFSSDPVHEVYEYGKCDKACVSISTIESVSSSDSSLNDEYEAQPPSYNECIDEVHMDVERGRSREVATFSSYRPLAPSLPPPTRHKPRDADVAPQPPKFKYISERNEYNQRIKVASLGPPQTPPLPEITTPMVTAHKNQIIIQLPHSHIINPRIIYHISREINQLDLLNTEYNNWFTLLKLVILIWLLYISLANY